MFPPLYEASDQASLRAQKNYLKLVGTDIFLMLVSSALSVYLFPNDLKILIATISAIVLGLSIISTAILRIIKYEKIWFAGRAIAESIKSLSWKYMMEAEPFEKGKSENNVEKEFLTYLGRILNENLEMQSIFGSTLNETNQITQEMKRIRCSDYGQRKKTYIEQRIKDQRIWYSRKCKSNKDRERNWFIIILITQISAFVSAVIFIRIPESSINLTGFFTLAATAGIGWLQLKQHQELAQTYGLAASELGLILEQSNYINNEEELSNFVADSENAISREHTMWLARRRFNY